MGTLMAGKACLSEVAVQTPQGLLICDVRVWRCLVFCPSWYERGPAGRGKLRPFFETDREM